MGVFVSASRSLHAIRTAEIVERGLLADVKERQCLERMAIAGDVDERRKKRTTSSIEKLAGLTPGSAVKFLSR